MTSSIAKVAVGLPVAGDEPFTRLLCQGMVIAGTYYRETADGKKRSFEWGQGSLFAFSLPLAA